MTVLLLNQNVVASCNPKIDIVKDSNNEKYHYSKECHIEFGRLYTTKEDKEMQIQHLNESIKLKDLAINTANKRIELWQNSTYKVEDRLLKIEKNNEKLKWLYFGLGIFVMGGAVWGAGQLRK